MINGNKVSSIVPLSRKKNFSMGIVNLSKTRFCNNCKGNIIFDTCNNRNNQVNQIEANLIDSKKLPTNDYGHMIPYFKDID